MLMSAALGTFFRRTASITTKQTCFLHAAR